MRFRPGVPREINKVSSLYNVGVMDDSTGSKLQRGDDEYRQNNE